MKKIIIIPVILSLFILTKSVKAKYIYGKGKKEYLTIIKKGFAFLKKKQFEKAARYFRYSVDNLPGRIQVKKKAYVYSLIAYSYFKIEKYKLSCDWYKKSILIYGKMAMAYRGIAICYSKLNNKKAALKWIKKAEKIEPKNKKTFYFIANLYQIIEYYQIAIKYYNHIIFVYDTEIQALQQKANCLSELKKYNAAINTLKRILIKKPKDKFSINLLGIIYARKKMFIKARSLYYKLLNYYPRYASGYYNLACIFALSGDNKKALKALEISFRLGYKNFDEILKDKDLANIRNLPEFNALINKYRSNNN